MPGPFVAGRHSIKLDMEPGTYWWCACGRSQNQPFCDGSHKGTEFSPVEVEVTEPQRIAFCQCKHTGNAPRCDGSHGDIEGQ